MNNLAVALQPDIAPPKTCDTPQCLNLAQFLDLDAYTQSGMIIELCFKCYEEQNLVRLSKLKLKKEKR